MNSLRLFQTESLDLASYLAVAVAAPVIELATRGKRALFTFPETTDLLTAVVNYERGESLPAKRLLNARSWLFREASSVVKNGGARP